MNLFKNQIWHLVFLLISIPLLIIIIKQSAFNAGEYLGFSTTFWFWAAIAVAIVHQVFIWLSWRLQLKYQIYNKLFKKAGFFVYAFKFQVLFWGRFVVIILLALSNPNSTSIPPQVAFTILVIIAFPVLITLLSVVSYFGFSRAMGIDHFEENYRNIPLVKGGTFKLSSNAMYTFAALAFFLPGLYWLSASALVAGIFQYLYLWIHYFCTEKPDMEYIYG